MQIQGNHVQTVMIKNRIGKLTFSDYRSYYDAKVDFLPEFLACPPPLPYKFQTPHCCLSSCLFSFGWPDLWLSNLPEATAVWAGRKLGRISTPWFWGRILTFQGNLLLLIKPSDDWMRPAHIVIVNFLCLKPTNFRY